jgi:two-component system osmolarity sensor histidine kinase EnvZ
MVLVPLVVALLIVTNAFFGNHWKRVHSTLAHTLSGEVATMMHFMERGDNESVQMLARDIGINVSVNDKLNRPKHNDNHSREAGQLAKDLQTKIKQPVSVYIDRGKRLLYIDIPTNDGKIATFGTSMYRIYSTSTEVFLIWIIGAILIVSVLITPFMIYHIRSIRNIARAANKFGRGMDAPGFKPSGSLEIREAANAMINMKERLNRYNKTRTDMLNAVGHDLKTPLTRMRIATETNSATKEDLLHNIDRMTEMVNGYLAFARGETPEIEQAVELPAMLTRIARDSAPDKKIILNLPTNPMQFYARPNSLTSAFTNIIENAARFAKKKIQITEIDEPETVTVIIEDDGPGIPDDKKALAMQPFVRLDESRNESTGGTGLGLSIAQTAIENHGGQIFLENSDLGGLKVRIVLPL